MAAAVQSAIADSQTWTYSQKRALLEKYLEEHEAREQMFWPLIVDALANSKQELLLTIKSLLTNCRTHVGFETWRYWVFEKCKVGFLENTPSKYTKTVNIVPGHR